jgi:hypothetical protein
LKIVEFRRVDPSWVIPLSHRERVRANRVTGQDEIIDDIADEIGALGESRGGARGEFDIHSFPSPADFADSDACAKTDFGVDSSVSNRKNG